VLAGETITILGADLAVEAMKTSDDVLNFQDALADVMCHLVYA
jgi:hypothetical protein